VAGLCAATIKRWLVVALLLLPFALLPRTGSADIEVQDDSGRTVHLTRAARRIVSLAPHATELLFDVGAGDKLVGVVSYSDYPPAARALPRIGGAENLNLEAIIALRPDLVVAWQSGNPRPQVERLQALGIAVFYSEPRRLDDIATNLLRLGELAGTRRVAEQAAQIFRAAYKNIGRQYAQRPPVRTFYQIWHQPLMTINGEHLISQVIELCGGRNIFAGLGTLAPVINREAVLAADPQLIVAGSRSPNGQHELDVWRAWPQISAVRDRQLYVIDPDIIQRQTPRVLQGATILCRQLVQARRALHADPAAVTGTPAP